MTSVDDYALVLNAGSSSLKFCVFQRPQDGAWQVEARGQIEGIGTSPRLSAKDGDGRTAARREAGPVGPRRARRHRRARGWLRSHYGGRIVGVGHRVVHGGPRFRGPTVVTREVLAELRELTPLAPLHQPHNLAPIEAIFERMPDVPQVACFDTGFHRGHAGRRRARPAARASSARGGVQRYGFHGLSYEYIASVLPRSRPRSPTGA